MISIIIFSKYPFKLKLEGVHKWRFWTPPRPCHELFIPKLMHSRYKIHEQLTEGWQVIIAPHILIFLFLSLPLLILSQCFQFLKLVQKLAFTVGWQNYTNFTLPMIAIALTEASSICACSSLPSSPLRPSRTLSSVIIFRHYKFRK